jgi:L-seryl-tRNA(Ser) seleniumtransferase
MSASDDATSAVPDAHARLRALPKVDELFKRDDVAALLEVHPRAVVVDALRGAIDAARDAILAGEAAAEGEDAIVGDAVARVEAASVRSLRRVVNATGIIIHTNLGRSILAEEAVEAVAEVTHNYSTLEYDVPSGERGSRHVHVEELLCRLTGAEAAMAVNNNASAVLLGIAALAEGKEAIVSRGQLVEIGGSFRIPDIMSQSGAAMVEVGTTNKTHLRDYRRAITDRTGLLLKVHTSNFRLVGFVQEVPLEELVELGRERGIPVFEDQGSGVLVDLTQFGLPHEPTLGEAVAKGADLVSGSGDKLLGGPQAGILLGRAEVIAALKRHPLARVLRLDKMTLAALEATLRLYLDPEAALARVPTLRMLTATSEEMAERARALGDRVRDACADAYETSVEPDVSRSGGGALPMVDIPTHVLVLTPRRMGVVELEAALRTGDPAIVTRIHEDRLHVDPRTLSASDETELVDALSALAG